MSAMEKMLMNMLGISAEEISETIENVKETLSTLSKRLNNIEQKLDKLIGDEKDYDDGK